MLEPLTRRCSMSAYMDGPWRCGSGDCMGRRADCEVPRRNAAEARTLEVLQASVEVENAWAEALGLEVAQPTKQDAQRIVVRHPSRPAERRRPVPEPGVIYCASPRAIQAAGGAYPLGSCDGLADALIAAHHPSLGVDRSVSLRDVLAFLRDDGADEVDHAYAHRLELKFGGPDA